MYLILEFAHKILSEHIKPGDVCVDATCGNGYDTLHLAKLVGAKGKVYAFDIQKQALINTKEVCKDYTNIEYILDSHEAINKYVKEKIKAVIFNLGYLPKGNKKITTLSHSTINAIKSLLPLISEFLLIVIVVYPGHPEGKKESDALESMLINLEKDQYFVTKYQNYNRELSPYILTISPNKRK